MTRQLNVDRLLDGWLAEGPSELPDRVIDGIIGQLDETERRRLRWLPPRPTMNRTIFAVGSAAALVVAAFGVSYYARLDGPGSPTPSASGATAVPSAPMPTATPSQASLPFSPTAWSVESASQDWPGAARLEPDADPFTAPALSGQEICELHPSILSSVVLGGEERCSLEPTVEDDPQSPRNVYVDVTDESALESIGVIDIRAVAFREECWFKPATCVYFDTVERVERPLPHPQEQWIAFGIVADTNDDGKPDVRYGIDNAPTPPDAPLGTEQRQRMWRANLVTGNVEYYTHAFEVPSVMDAIFPGDAGTPFGPTTGRVYAHREGSSPFRFYVWASLIRDGHVVATDYAPHAGWLEAE